MNALEHLDIASSKSTQSGRKTEKTQNKAG
jgi:hypothetical protein